MKKEYLKATFDEGFRRSFVKENPHTYLACLLFSSSVASWAVLHTIVTLIGGHTDDNMTAGMPTTATMIATKASADPSERL